MNTHESYVSLEVAKLLKEAGFDWEVEKFYWYDKQERKYFLTTLRINEQPKSNEYFAPTLDVAQRWLRENNDFDINVLTDFDSVKRLYYVRYVVKDGYYKTYYITKNQSYVYFNAYEEAQEAGIKKALETILEKGE